MNYCFKLNFEYKNNYQYIVFSIPKNNHYQKIKNLSIYKKNKLLIDKKNQNKLILFPNKKNISPYVNFELKCLSIKKTIYDNFTLNDYNNFFIVNNEFINGKDKLIKKLSKKIVNDKINLKLIVDKLYNFTLNYLEYGKPIDDLYDYKTAYLNKITDCGGFSTFLASLFHSLNIPTRLVIGYIIKKDIFKNFFSALNLNSYDFSNLLIHAWLEILLPDNSWYPLDPAIEWKRLKKLSKKQGGNGFIPDDRLVISYGCQHKIKINNQYYQFPIFQK